MRPRLIPVLLLDEAGLLVKTTRFGAPRYIGDPINAVHIFNDKGVDELFLLDISAARSRRPPRLELIRSIVSEAFMPVGYGGGLSNIGDVRSVLRLGIEKVVFNTSIFETPQVIIDASERFGAQAVVAAIDFKTDFFGRRKATTRGGRTLAMTPEDAARKAVGLGVGEVLLTSIDREGTGLGYDVETTRRVSLSVPVPVVACGGAASISDVEAALSEGGASAAAASSIFVYYGRRRAVLINVPQMAEPA
jgi:cyclase